MTTYYLINDRVRENALQAVRDNEAFGTVSVLPKRRSGGQNDCFHAICHDLEKSKFTFAGKPRTQEEWKVLLISAPAVATKAPGEVIPGIEGEFVAIRESSAKMSSARASSLIEYALAYCASNGVQLLGYEASGWGGGT